MFFRDRTAPRHLSKSSLASRMAAALVVLVMLGLTACSSAATPNPTTSVTTNAAPTSQNSPSVAATTAPTTTAATLGTTIAATTAAPTTAAAATITVTPSPTWLPTATAGPTYTPIPTPTLGPPPSPTVNLSVTERPGYKLVWSDEFEGPAGNAANPAVWSNEKGDGTLNGNTGWGNNELEYYTEGNQNAALDGKGNLVISVRKADPAAKLQCYYGPCQYTSARLITAHKVQVSYGRIETRVKVPAGSGTWPAFWALGANIDRMPWPQSGEIDIMEYVGRQPTRVFGTIHGPGYSGANGFSKTYNLPNNVADDFHVFAIDWEKDQIVWTIDNIVYNRATPASVANHEWVFNQPFFLILNVAIGGNLGGTVPSSTTFPQTMTVDYVRQYQKNP